MGDWIDFENWQIYRYKLAAVTMATMVNKIVFTVISSKCNHAELIDNHYFGIGW